MRQLQAVVLVLAVVVTGGCLTGSSSRHSALPGPTNPGEEGLSPGTKPAEVILLDVAQIERPRGDPFLNNELWADGDEQGIDMETKAVLEENGLRVCQIGGLLPPRLQALLSSPHTCPDPRRLRGEVDQPTPVLISPPRGRCAFCVRHNGTKRAVEVEQAHCFFEVVPSLEGRRIRLRFTPRIKHGEPRLETRVAKDADGSLRWAVEARERVEDVPELSWELTIWPDEYVVVGARLKEPDTLGCAYFLPGGPQGPVQKLLVLRATQVPVGQEVDEKLHQSPPLALQATWMDRRQDCSRSD